MPRRRHRSASLTGAALTAAALLLGVASPAAANTDGLFTIGANEDDEPGFVSVAASDAAMTWLGSPIDAGIDEVHGAEIAGEQGWAIGTSNGSVVVLPWNHSTGATGTPVAISLEPGSLRVGDEVIDSVVGLDALPDGTLLTIMFVSSNTAPPTSYPAIFSLDPATGAGIRLLDLPELSAFGDDWYFSLATDPITGITHVFMMRESNAGPRGLVLAVDLEAASVGSPVELSGLSALLGEMHFPLGADFDEDGRLWLVVAALELGEYRLLSFASGFTAAATPSDVGELSLDSEPYFGETFVLAVRALDSLESDGLPASGSEYGGGLIIAVALGLLGLCALSASALAGRRTQRPQLTPAAAPPSRASSPRSRARMPWPRP